MSFSQSKLSDQENKPKQQKTKSFYFLPKFGCMRFQDDAEAAEAPDIEGSFDVEASHKGTDHVPTHLIVMVNGIIGSAQDWRYGAKKFVKAFPQDVIVHCSESNSSMLTFNGVDVMGKRLADEVISVVKRHPNLQKISFVAHSLGGLVARYAAACLYEQDFTGKSSKDNSEYMLDELKESSEEMPPTERIAGLEPVNFITSATPHLGSRGHKQVPGFCGFKTVEKVASHASGLLGRTGKHLFLRDHENGKPPLLLQISSDSDNLKFISALKSFKRRVAYANTHHDHLVGWSSSSLRNRNQLPKRRNLQKDARYPHIVHEDPSRMVNTQDDHSPDAKVARSRRREMEEDMIRGLTAALSWERVDVNFGGSMQRLVAHNTIQACRRLDAAGKVGISLIGSQPPRCERMCQSNCGHCKAVQVPIPSSHLLHRFTTHAYSRGDGISNYKPMCWKCRCIHNDPRLV
ncbi:hypothetical protein F511_01308 [Dorcoceras hygrometricum]|uniref:DUF676 domain-containing protein n=1 Tax=Dorcoceras hygrometricum TaxID=472368 RepID=A0A2Z7D5T9_9LAMI|nr:hypothetical protein F511_01308 [Dorcoceras hygrometricum]